MTAVEIQTATLLVVFAIVGVLWLIWPPESEHSDAETTLL